MNTYEITFQRENGTTGSGRFTAATETQARRDFKEVYRHWNGTITNVELVAEGTPATKEQERKALIQIKKIVDSLGKNSYIGTAFEGCLEDAENNIENDFGESMKSRWEDAERRLTELNRATTEEINRLRNELTESEKDYEAFRCDTHTISEEKDIEMTSLRRHTLSADDICNISQLLSDKVLCFGQEVSNAAERIVEVADQPDSAAFQNAVKDHRAAKADLNYYTALLIRVNFVKNAE